MAKGMTDGKIAAALRGGDIPQEFLLGFGVVSTVPDTPVSGVKLNRLWGMEGLDPDLIPQKREPVHAFQTACRSVETKRRTTGNEDGVLTEVKVDEIVNSPDECAYQITRLVRDKEHRLIDHPKAMRVVYTKATATITVEPLDPEHYRLLRGMEKAIRDHFEENASKVPGSKVRAAIREYMKRVGATNARGRSGGFYFVPVEGKETLDSIRAVLEGLHGEKASMVTLPVINGDYERKMVEDQYTVNASSEIDELLAEVINYRKKGTVRTDKLDNLIARRSALSQTREKYEGLLNTELDLVASKIDGLDEVLEKLMEAKYSE